MAEAFLTLGRVAMLIYVLLFLLFPLAFAALVPSRASSESARIAVRGRLVMLTLATFVLLGVWGGLVISGLRFPGAMVMANFWWPWFFPLWFFLAWPTVALKRPDWGSNVHGPASPGGSAAGAGDVRSASLINRERRNPVAPWMWAIPLLVFLLALGAIAARGMQPFPTGTESGGAAADQAGLMAADSGTEPWRLTELGKTGRSRWALILSIYAVVFLPLLLMLPRMLRRALLEPEPMDTRGYAELTALYDRQRRTRVLGLFWISGVLAPAAVGVMHALMVWSPNDGKLWGLLGGIGGTAIGIAGGIFGIWMTVERGKIAKLKARLEKEQSVPQ